MIKWLRRRRNTRLEKRIADLQSQLDAKDRVIEVQTAEIDSLAAVIARDRARIEAETAIHNRHRANAEGNNVEQLDQSTVQFPA